MSVTVLGTGVSSGIVIARVRLESALAARTANFGAALAPAQERDRLDHAIRQVVASFQAADQHARAWPLEVRAIVDGHRHILEDEAFAEPIRSLIGARQCTAEEALLTHEEEVLDALEQIDDPYLAARRDDLESLFGKVLTMLSTQRDTGADASPAQETGDLAAYVLVCADPAPTDLLLPRSGTLTGLISERGGQLSHTTIVARSLGLPYVAGLADATCTLQPDQLVIVDGASGLVITDPDPHALVTYRERQQLEQRRKRSLQSAPALAGPVATRDRIAVEIMSNVRGPGDLTASRRLQVDGVGLYRTEFLYANRDDLPSEEEHYNSYRLLVQGMGGSTVTIRTLDACAGPQLRSLSKHLPRTSQPALGLRAIRLCLQHPELFAPQIRALLRAARHGPLRILLPMIATPAELRAALAFIDDCREALDREGVTHEQDVPVGVMIEVPAAAMCARTLAREAAFLSIGTNDLIQYTLAIDRDDDAVQSLYEPAHPAVLRLIRDTLAAGAAVGTPVALCGEMAGDPRFTRLLLGLGLTHFSMSPTAIPEVKCIVAETNVTQVRAQAQAIAECDCPEESQHLLAVLNAD
ncbi:MAG: phosphoenolpyruvate--protein phosphotransferase [Pseudomonadota bacterium]